ncbi:hypothetical protein PTET_a3332 [Pseudoalteromonas tetraodonis]|nr:hypothetical protein PTET_a3332 [Pseudoalteromonas tetraodonis]
MILPLGSNSIIANDLCNAFIIKSLLDLDCFELLNHPMLITTFKLFALFSYYYR